MTDIRNTGNGSRLLAILFPLVALVSSGAAIAADCDDKVEWLFVQNASAVTLEEGVLTLKGINPSTVFFSDRPERLAGLGATTEFVTYWSTGGGSDNFKSDPPNAVLSIVTDDSVDDIALTLMNPRLDGDTLIYDVTVIEGRIQVDAGACSLFVDVVGRPLTPVSVAGVDRRATRRTVRRVAR